MVVLDEKYGKLGLSKKGKILPLPPLPENNEHTYPGGVQPTGYTRGVGGVGGALWGDDESSDGSLTSIVDDHQSLVGSLHGGSDMSVVTMDTKVDAGKKRRPRRERKRSSVVAKVQHTLSMHLTTHPIKYSINISYQCTLSCHPFSSPLAPPFPPSPPVSPLSPLPRGGDVTQVRNAVKGGTDKHMNSVPIHEYVPLTEMDIDALLETLQRKGPKDLTTDMSASDNLACNHLYVQQDELLNQAGQLQALSAKGRNKGVYGNALQHMVTAEYYLDRGLDPKTYIRPGTTNNTHHTPSGSTPPPSH